MLRLKFKNLVLTALDACGKLKSLGFVRRFLKALQPLKSACKTVTSVSLRASADSVKHLPALAGHFQSVCFDLLRASRCEQRLAQSTTVAPLSRATVAHFRSKVNKEEFSNAKLALFKHKEEEKSVARVVRAARLLADSLDCSQAASLINYH